MRNKRTKGESKETTSRTAAMAPARGCPPEMGALKLAVLFMLVSTSVSFQLTRQPVAHRAERSSGRATLTTSGQLNVSPYAFQQARLTEQLRLSGGQRSKIPLQQQQTVEEEGLSSEHATAAEVGDRSEEAHVMMATESEAGGEIPMAPMMTYSKYLTMQVSL